MDVNQRITLLHYRKPGKSGTRDYPKTKCSYSSLKQYNVLEQGGTSNFLGVTLKGTKDGNRKEWNERRGREISNQTKIVGRNGYCPSRKEQNSIKKEQKSMKKSKIRTAKIKYLMRVKWITRLLRNYVIVGYWET